MVARASDDSMVITEVDMSPICARYVNNRETHRIEPDPVRGPLVAKVFDLYASGEYSLGALRQKAREIGLTHWRGDRPMTKSELHRMLQNPIYTGDFVWLGKSYRGSHTPLITHDTFERAQAVLNHKPRGRYCKQRHAFMGLLRCARCGCSMTAEQKKGRYVYYRCTGFKGRCGNTYIREEALSELLGTTVQAVQLPPDIAESLARRLRDADGEAERERLATRQRLEDRRRKVLAKLDRGYDDYVEGRVTEDFWARKSEQWEDERRLVEAELVRLASSNGSLAVTGEKTLELAKQADFLYKTQDPAQQRHLLETVLSNCTFDRGSLSPTYSSPFDLFARGNETGDWR